MKILLTADIQDMIISLERIDVDYLRCDAETSKKIASRVYDILPLLSPRVLEVFIHDIETQREHFINMKSVHKTIDNWCEVEKRAVELLKSKYNIDSILRGLYTEFSWSPEGFTYKHDKEIEITDTELSKIMKYAFTYALPRHTYVVGETIDFIKAYKDKLTPEDKAYILERITDRCKRFESESESSFRAFDSHDVEQWRRFESELK